MLLTIKLVSTWTSLAASPLTMTFEASMPFLMRNSMLLRLALGSKLSIVSRTMSKRSKGTNSMSRLPASILVMTSRSSSNPDMRSTFLAAFSRNFRLISGSSMPPSSKVRMKPWMLKMGVLSSWAKLPMNSCLKVSVSRRLVISSIWDSAQDITSRLTCSTMSLPMSKLVWLLDPLKRRMVL